jgi:hypothetical protein
LDYNGATRALAVSLRAKTIFGTVAVEETIL